MKQNTDGLIAFHIEVKIDVAELREWEPERIKALFAGVAMVLEAKQGKQAERLGGGK